MINQQGFSPTIRIGGKQRINANEDNATAIVNEEKNVTQTVIYANIKTIINIIKLVKSA